MPETPEIPGQLPLADAVAVFAEASPGNLIAANDWKFQSSPAASGKADLADAKD
jgi:hypothetical protein